MSRIDELIEQLCPDGVEFRTLRDVAYYSRDRIDSSEISPGSYVGVNELLPDFQGRTLEVRDPSETKCIEFFRDDILLGNIRPYLKKMWLANCSGGTNGDVLVIRIKDRTRLSPKFLWQVLASSDFVNYNVQHSHGAKMPRGDKASILDYRIPLPPTEIQEEIVRILDSFSELEAELEAELEKRKKQYVYYRDHLLSRSNLDKMAKEEVDIVALGSLGSFYGGLSGKTKADFINGNASYIPYTNIYNNIAVNLANLPSVIVSEHEHQHEIHLGDVLVTGSSETPDDCGMTSVVVHEPIEKTYLNSFCFGWRPHSTSVQNLEPGFLKYALRSSEARKQIVRTANGVTRFNVSKKSFANVKIPIPPIAIQKYVIEILDKFDALVNDLSSGIPAEIEARRKQYEYYRDKLLTFKEKPGD